MVGTCEFEHHANLCPSGETKRKKDHGANKFSMKKVYKRSYQYRCTHPPKAILKAKLDNIAIVPASILPFKKTLQELINTLPQGAVFLCHAEKNTRQRKLLERVAETFRQQGHAVMNLSMEQVYKNTANFEFI
jgi:hypothetical protein